VSKTLPKNSWYVVVEEIAGCGPGRRRETNTAPFMVYYEEALANFKTRTSVYLYQGNTTLEEPSSTPDSACLFPARLGFAVTAQYSFALAKRDISMPVDAIWKR
jgi:hypothetical protein